MGLEPSVGYGASHRGHRRGKQSPCARADRLFAMVIELVRRAPEHAGENGPRRVVMPEASAELAGVVPAYGLFPMRDLRERRESLGRELNEGLYANREGYADFGVQLGERKRATAVDGDHATMSVEACPNGARVRREGRRIAGQSQRQSTAAREQRNGSAHEGRGRIDGVPRLAPCGAQIAASNEKRVRGVGSYGGVGRKFSRPSLRPGIVLGKALNHPDGGRGCDATLP